MLDQDIRRALRVRAARLHSEDPQTRVVEELHLGPDARADLVVLNGRIEGYEIKSDRDSLARLEHQVGAYEAVCDRVWLVTTERYADVALQRLPPWWGVLVARSQNGGITLVRRRAAKAHRRQRVSALVELLWRGELALVCERYGIAGSRSRSTATALRASITDASVSCREVAKDVRRALLLREDWRAVPPCASGDAPFPPDARRSDSRSTRLPPHRRR